MSRSWPVPWAKAALPHGLPGRALTVLQLGDRAHEGDWRRGVRDLVDGLVSTGSPVIYVQCGGLGNYFDGEDEWLAAASPLLQLVSDEDVVVQAPILEGPAPANASKSDPVRAGFAYHCHVPSVDYIEVRAEGFEASSGPSLLLLLQAELLRPYFEFDVAPLVPTPDGLTLTPEEVNAWRTWDLIQLANRRESPTVAVWTMTDVESAGLAHLVDASHVHIKVLAEPSTDRPDARILVRSRSDASKPWSKLTSVLVRHRPRKRASPTAGVTDVVPKRPDPR